MEKYTVTITRQFGSLGRPIAHRLSELLDINYYDRDLVEAAAVKLQLPVSAVSKEEESAGGQFFGMQFPMGREAELQQDRVFAAQREIILNIADRESSIIVGRCADAILQNMKRHISIYIYAPYDARLHNCVETLGMSKASAEKMIAKVDRARAAYHKRYAKFRPEDIRYKDILLDSSLLGASGTAEYLSILIKSKFHGIVLPFPGNRRNC